MTVEKKSEKSALTPDGAPGKKAWVTPKIKSMDITTATQGPMTLGDRPIGENIFFYNDP